MPHVGGGGPQGNSPAGVPHRAAIAVLPNGGELANIFLVLVGMKILKHTFNLHWRESTKCRQRFKPCLPQGLTRRRLWPLLELCCSNDCQPPPHSSFAFGCLPRLTRMNLALKMSYTYPNPSGVLLICLVEVFSRGPSCSVTPRRPLRGTAPLRYPLVAAQFSRPAHLVLCFIARCVVLCCVVLSNQQFSGINTEVLQDMMKEMLLLNTGFQENKPFYEVYARDHVISELTDPASVLNSRYLDRPAGTVFLDGERLSQNLSSCLGHRLLE